MFSLTSTERGVIRVRPALGPAAAMSLRARREGATRGTSFLKTSQASMSPGAGK
jgi:hypothetical protein